MKNNASAKTANPNTVLVEKIKTHKSLASILLKIFSALGLIWTISFASVNMDSDMEEFRSIMCIGGICYTGIMILVDTLRGRKPLNLYCDRLEGYAVNISQQKTIYLSNVESVEKNYNHSGMKALTVITKDRYAYTFTEIDNIQEYCDKIVELRGHDDGFKGSFYYPSIFSKDNKGNRGSAVFYIVGVIIIIIIIAISVVNHEPKKNYSATDMENHKWASDAKDFIDANKQYYR